jgi:hypothetical protein
MADPKVKIKRTAQPNLPPASLEPGELSVEMSTPFRMWVGVPTALDPAGMKQITHTALVSEQAPLFPTNGLLWWESDSGTLWMYYVDANSAQWVQAAGSSGSRGGGGGGMDQASADLLYVNLVGDQMSGNLTITKLEPNFILNKPLNSSAKLTGMQSGIAHWDVVVGNAGVGSDFTIVRHSDMGVALDAPLSISRATGDVTVSHDPTVPLGVVTKQYSDLKVSKAGDTMTGPLTIHSPANAGAIILDLQSQIFLYFNSSTNHAAISTNAGGDMTFTTGSVGTASTLTLLSDHALTAISDTTYKPNGGTWVAGSDERIKNITGTYDHGLQQILSLSPMRYMFKGNDTFDPPTDPAYRGPTPPVVSVPYPNSMNHLVARDRKEFIGLIAQEAETVMPELVKKRPGYINGQPVTDLRTLDASALTYALINAVKELHAEINKMKTYIGMPIESGSS